MHQFVIPPIIAAKLDHVIDLAHGLSISALNAKVITARSGESGRALAPLTNHITENTNEILDIVYKITDYSIEFSNSTIQMERLEKSLNLFKQANKLHGKPHDTLENIIKENQEKLDIFSREHEEKELTLIRMLERLKDITKTFEFISINCSIEASHVPAIEQDFSVVANVLKDAGVFIKNILDECFTLLNKNNNSKIRHAA